MTSAEFIHQAAKALRSWNLAPYFLSAALGLLYGQPGRGRRCYPQEGKWFMKSYNGLVRNPDGEFYDAYHLWSLDGNKLDFLGSHHRL